MFHGKPIIGLVGGICSGKSFVAGLFGELGCLVVDSDRLARQVFEQADVKSALVEWWGGAVLHADGSLDRRKIADIIFNDAKARGQLEGMVHPRVNQARDALMATVSDNPAVPAIVWDSPLLLETGLGRDCDAVVFVDCPDDVRLDRAAARGWDEPELRRRENAQLPLDKKRSLSDYVIDNSRQPSQVRGQTRDVLNGILNRSGQ